MFVDELASRVCVWLFGSSVALGANCCGYAMSLAVSAAVADRTMQVGHSLTMSHTFLESSISESEQ